MGLRRLAISNPSANTDTTLFTSDSQYLMSVIATNKSSTTSENIRVWVQPSGSSTSAEYAYIVYDIPVDQTNSYETFRFAVNQNDIVKVRANGADISFQAYGLVQYDINLGVGISSYRTTAPATPVDGLIWIDSDATPVGGQKPAYVYDSNAATWLQIVGGVDVNANYTFTGNINVPTAGAGNSSTKAASTAFVYNNFEKLIPLQSSAPTSPTSGDLWVDNTISTAPILKVYNGSSWLATATASTDRDLVIAQRMFA